MDIKNSRALSGYNDAAQVMARDCPICFLGFTKAAPDKSLINLCENYHPMHASCMTQYLSSMQIAQLDSPKRVQPLECPTCRQPLTQKMSTASANDSIDLKVARLKYLQLSVQKTHEKLLTLTMLGLRKIQRTLSEPQAHYIFETMLRALNTQLANVQSTSLILLHLEIYQELQQVKSTGDFNISSALPGALSVSEYATNIQTRLKDLNIRVNEKITLLTERKIGESMIEGNNKNSSGSDPMIQMNGLVIAMNQINQSSGRVQHFNELINPIV